MIWTLVEAFIGASVAFGLGFAWYTFLFGSAWQRETGLKSEDIQNDMAKVHSSAFLMMFILCFGVNYVINMHPVEAQTFAHGGFHGAQVGLMYSIPAVAITYLYQRRSLKLFFIDTGYILFFMALAGAVMAAIKLG